jgi:hypothetical protein
MAATFHPFPVLNAALRLPDDLRESQGLIPGGDPEPVQYPSVRSSVVNRSTSPSLRNTAMRK